MITFVQSVTVPVADQDAALRFWTEKVGFEKRDDTPMGEGVRWLEVAPPGGQTVLVLMPGRSPGVDTTVVVDTDDFAATKAELTGRGVQFVGEQQGSPAWGWTQTFTDGDGNRFTLHQRGGA